MIYVYSPIYISNLNRLKHIFDLYNFQQNHLVKILKLLQNQYKAGIIFLTDIDFTKD